MVVVLCKRQGLRVRAAAAVVVRNCKSMTFQRLCWELRTRSRWHRPQRAARGRLLIRPLAELAPVALIAPLQAQAILGLHLQVVLELAVSLPPIRAAVAARECSVMGAMHRDRVKAAVALVVELLAPVLHHPSFTLVVAAHSDLMLLLAAARIRRSMVPLGAALVVVRILAITHIPVVLEAPRQQL